MKRSLLRFCIKQSPTTVAANLKQKTLNNFITLPIFYVNGDPHIGHLYSVLIGDALNRWENLKLNNAKTQQSRIFSGGTDEHGIKIESTAKLAGRLPQEHCDLYNKKFQKLFQLFNISTTQFVRTTEPRHRQAVHHFWNTLIDNESIKKQTYSGWYSLVDECFYNENDTEEIAKDTRNVVEFAEEDNYMFNLEDYLKDVRYWLVHSDVIYPKHFLPIVLKNFPSNGQLSISRNAERCRWGIPVPNDPNQTIYVWFDALINYLTVAGYPNVNFSSMHWPPSVQIIGKDIAKFHAIYWPAFLMAAKLPLPKKIFVHSHWLVDKVKMSKSIGNVVDPFNVSKTLTVDGLRYFLLKQGVPHDDGNFTLLKAISVVNADLVNNLGNFLQRTTAKSLNLSQIYPSFDLKAMEHKIKETEGQLVTELNTLLERVGNYYEAMMFYKGLETINKTLKHANAFFQLHEPWKMSQNSDLSTVLFLAYETSRICSVLLQPIVPFYSANVFERLGISKDERTLTTAKLGGTSLNVHGRKLGINQGPIIKRIDTPPL